MAFTLTTSGAILIKAGSDIDTSIASSGAVMGKVCDEAEATFCGLTRYDWITNYSSIKTSFKAMIDDAVSDLAGMKLINYNLNGYGLNNAQTMLDVLKDNSNKIIAALVEDKGKSVVI